jgi:hypothetical protein
VSDVLRIMERCWLCRLGLTKTGQGSRIEAIARAIPTLIVPGGSEDVLLDLGVREALKLSDPARKSRL